MVITVCYWFYVLAIALRQEKGRRKMEIEQNCQLRKIWSSEKT